MPQEPDATDLKLLQALQLDGRAPYARIAHILGVSDQTVARRYRRLRNESGLRVLGMTDHSRLGRTNWIVRLGCAPQAAEQLATALARRPDTSYVNLMSGGTEVVCAMKPRSLQDRDELLFDRIQRTPRVTTVDAYSVLHSFYGAPLGWLNKINALDPAQAAALRPPPTAPAADPVTLDAIDDTLLATLQRDGRATLGELQAGTGQSEAAIARRVERLRETGVLYFDIEYRHEPLGRGVQAMLWLTVAPSELAQAGHTLAAHPEVRFAAATSGKTNIAASVLCRTSADLYRYLTDRIGPIAGIQTVETVLTLRQIKVLTYAPTR